ncbi:MAG: hypothetical protein R3282_06555 [Rhodothermales bacterium]|nr:hypothetical protein [Rhodothermales bacterium]
MHTRFNGILCSSLIVSAVFALQFLLAGCSPASNRPLPTIVTQDFESGTDANLVGLSVVDGNVWWAGGAEGTVLRTVDGGANWSVFVIAPEDSLQFRDVHGVDSVRAYALGIGPGDKSRIYRTADGGASWTLTWKATDPNDFFDCFDFWTATAGLLIGDTNYGRIRLMRTDDGASWRAVDDTAIPMSRGKEGGFAASGTCLVTKGDSLAWIATGSEQGSRIYRSSNRGLHWTVADVDIFAGHEAAGLMTLAFRNNNHGFAAGGVLAMPDESRPNLMETVDGGLTWERFDGPQLPNVYGLAVSPGPGSTHVIAVGPKGMDASFDDGRTWSSVDKRNYWSVQFIDDYNAVAVGPRGRVTVARLQLTAG